MKKILIIDDNLDSVETLSSLLEMKGYSVVNAFDGQNFFEITKNESPDLILLDVIMSDMNGFEVCQTLKSDFATKHIPIVLLTALSRSELPMKPSEVGANDCIFKPYNIKPFLEKINDLLCA